MSLSELRVRFAPGPAPASAKSQMAVARALGIDLHGARRLLEVGRTLPAPLAREVADTLVSVLAQDGFKAEAVEVPVAKGRCGSHLLLVSQQACERCGVAICELCVLERPDATCQACAAKGSRSKAFTAVRVGLLLCFLLGVVVWKRQLTSAREARTDWNRPLRVALVLVAEAPVPDDVLPAWTQGTQALQRWMASEFKGYRPGGGEPVHFELHGPVAVQSVPALQPSEAGVFTRLQHAWTMKGFLKQVHGAGSLELSAADVRIYVHLRQGQPRTAQWVEGVAEAGGDLGFIKAPLEETDLTLALTAVAHELFHCLGASDKYDAQGHSRIPEGLVTPGQEPLFPQDFAEVMVGERAEGAGQGRLPLSLDEVAVGPATARELRWGEGPGPDRVPPEQAEAAPNEEEQALEADGE